IRTSGTWPTGGSRPSRARGGRDDRPAPVLSMLKYLIRRTLISIPVLVGISLILFTILALAPGDPFEELATNANVPAEVRQNLRAKFGLDDPVAVSYARRLRSAVSGDWCFALV